MTYRVALEQLQPGTLLRKHIGDDEASGEAGVEDFAVEERPRHGAEDHQVVAVRACRVDFVDLVDARL